VSKSKILLYFCFSFIIGIIFSFLVKISQLQMLGFLILGITVISVLWRYKKFVITGFCLIFLTLGIWRHQTAEFKIHNNELIKYNLKQSAVFTGIVSEEPGIKEKSINLIISAEKLILDSGDKYISGKILILAGRYPEYKYGDKLKITGNLRAPIEDINGFNYRDYLAKDGIYLQSEWPKIELIKGNQGNVFYKYLFYLKNKLKEGLNRFLSSPQAGFLEALLFGDEQNISNEWKDKLNLSGTRHIAAVSGMNITIISLLIFNFLLFLGFWRNQAFYFSVILIVFYILMIGAPASALRAGVMAILFLTAQRFGRLSDASRIIILAAAFMLFLNPLLLKLDVGFQLSFLATMGLIYLQPIFLDFLKRIPDFFQLRQTLSATLAASVFAMPILVYNFGRVSLVSSFSNILIVPLLPLITILGFVFSFLGAVFQPLGWIFSWPVWLILTYIIKVIDLSSRVPLASITIESVHWLLLVFSYLILGALIFWLNKKKRLKFLDY
jgi:competence protein ComEC